MYKKKSANLYQTTKRDLSHTVYIGLGSNQGDRNAYISRAIHKLEQHITDIRVSPLYESDAMLLPESPKEWDRPFLNCVVSGKTSLPPHALLALAKHIEYRLGRPKNHPTWSPRTIDVDILHHGEQNITHKKLQLPHPGISDRAFVVYPLDTLDRSLRAKKPTDYLRSHPSYTLKEQFTSRGGDIDDFSIKQLYYSAKV